MGERLGGERILLHANMYTIMGMSTVLIWGNLSMHDVLEEKNQCYWHTSRYIIFYDIIIEGRRTINYMTTYDVPALVFLILKNLFWRQGIEDGKGT